MSQGARPPAGTGLGGVDPAIPLVLAGDSWEARYVRYLRRLQAAGKPVIIVTRLGDCPPNWFRTIADGRAET